MRRDGSSWSSNETEPGSNELFAVDGAGSEVFVVGTAGAIWRYTRP